MAKLYFYYSAMNAGKSTTLLQSSYNYRERNMRTLLFAPLIDTRYDTAKITSRIGLEADATSFDEQFNFFEYIQNFSTVHTKLHCILIDEAQFLTKKQVYQLTEVVDELNIPVIAYGLRSDYMGESFSGSQYLLVWADELVEIKTICHCGRKAVMNIRIDKDRKVIRQGQQVVIGGNDAYLSVCRRHFKKGDVGHFVPTDL